MLNGLVGSLGTGLFLAGSMLFFIRGVGLSPYQVAIGLSAAGAAGMIASVPAGMIADRIGARHALVGLHLWRALAYSSYIVVHSFTTFLIVVCATTMADKSSPPISQALVATLFSPAERGRIMGRVRASQNIGLSGGTLLAAVVLSSGTSGAYDLLAIGNGASYLVMAALIRQLPVHRQVRADFPPAISPARAPSRSQSPKATSPHFIALGTVNGVLALHDTVLFVGIPLWIAQYTAAPHALISSVLLINTVITALSQVWWNRVTRTTPKAIQGMVVAGWALALASLVIAITTGSNVSAVCLLLPAAAVLLTIGENLHTASAWEISFALAQSDKASRHLAVFNLGLSARDMAGPLLVTTVIIGLGRWGWVILAFSFIVAGLTSRRLALHLNRPRYSAERPSRSAPLIVSTGQLA